MGFYHPPAGSFHHGCWDAEVKDRYEAMFQEFRTWLDKRREVKAPAFEPLWELLPEPVPEPEPIPLPGTPAGIYARWWALDTRRAQGLSESEERERAMLGSFIDAESRWKAGRVIHRPRPTRPRRKAKRP